MWIKVQETGTGNGGGNGTGDGSKCWLVCKYDGSEKHFDPALHDQDLPVSPRAFPIHLHHSVMLLANNGSEETIPHLLPRRGLFHGRGGGTVCGREHGCVSAR